MRGWGRVVLGVVCVAGCSGDDEVVPDAGATDARPRPVDATPIDTDAVDCTTDIPCWEPDALASFCGRLRDVETGEAIVRPGARGLWCDHFGPEASGPCSVQIAFYDALRFAEDPTGAPPLKADAILVDDCGRFLGANVIIPFNQFIVMTTNDLTDADQYAITAHFFSPVSFGDMRQNIDARVTQRATDEMWTATAGNPFGGQTYSDKGVVLARYTHAGTPVSGVSVTIGGAVRPAYYFADPDTGASTVDPEATVTGPNGGALITDSSLGDLSGTGAEPAGCEWWSAVSGPIRGVVTYSRIPAVITGSPDIVCF